MHGTVEQMHKCASVALRMEEVSNECAMKKNKEELCGMWLKSEASMNLNN